jgi:peptidoglycan hydrolase-like protein with peptidoglycan-binding domain
MFSQNLVNAITEAANKAGIEPASLLALVEVETSGNAFEQDGRTPAFLYERHIAWRMAAKVSKALQSAFALAGLAIPKWSRTTQYKDQGTSAKRLALIEKARGIDAEVANQSASWGIGQTMGFLFAELGFNSACDMVAHMSGNLAGQIECMIAELRRKHLIEALNAHAWARVALGYNGQGYAANHYDTRLADAWKRWTRKLAGGGMPAPDMPATAVKALQKRLRDLGYASVGAPDGTFGTKTVGALSQFQAHEGLAVTGKYDDATRQALDIAEPIPAAPARARATAGDLKAAGSKTIKAADRVGLAGKAKIVVGSIFGGGAAADKLGLLDQAQDAVDKVNQAKGIVDSVRDLAEPLFSSPTVWIAAGVLIITGAIVVAMAEAIKAHRVEDHRTGVNAGPVEG